MKKRGGERRENDLFGQGASASISNVFTVNFGIWLCVRTEYHTAYQSAYWEEGFALIVCK